MIPSNGNNRLGKLVLSLLIIGLLISSRAVSQNQVLLVKPDRTNTLFPGGNSAAQFNARMTFWLELLEYAGFRVTVITESGLAELAERPDILVLPGVLCLSDRELQSIQNYISSGGGILATWGTGCRIENGEWRGYSFLQGILGAAPTNTEYPPNKAIAIQLRGGQPGTSTAPPGFRLKLTPDHIPLYIPQPDSVLVAGYWARTRYTEEIPDRITRYAAFINRELPSGGRFAWFGANLHTLHLDENNYSQYHTLFIELLKWLSGEGVASVTPWPRGKPSAVLIHGDVSDQFKSAENVLKEFKKIGIQSTFNLLVNYAANNPRTVQKLIEEGYEVCIQGDRFKSFKGQSFKQQQHRINLAISFIKSFNGSTVGFRPPLLQYDDNTINVMRHFEMLYINSDDQTDRDYPRNLYYDPLYPEGGLVTLFPKSELNDFDLLQRYNVRDRNRLVSIMLLDFFRIHNLQGLYKLSYSKQLLSDPELMPVIWEVIRKIENFNNSVWITSTREISQWVQNRESLEISTNSTDSALVVRLENKNDHPVGELVLKVFPPIEAPAEFLTPTRTSRNCTFDVVDSAFFLFLPELKAGEVFTAELSKRGGIPFNASSKKFLKYLFYGMIAIALIFIGSAVYYLVFTRKRKLVMEREDEDAGEGYSFTSEPEDQEPQKDLVSDMFTLPGAPPSTRQPVLESVDSRPAAVSGPSVMKQSRNAVASVKRKTADSGLKGSVPDTVSDLQQPAFLKSTGKSLPPKKQDLELETTVSAESLLVPKAVKTPPKRKKTVSEKPVSSGNKLFQAQPDKPLEVESQTPVDSPERPSVSPESSSWESLRKPPRKPVKPPDDGSDAVDSPLLQPKQIGRQKPGVSQVNTGESLQDELDQLAKKVDKPKRPLNKKAAINEILDLGIGSTKAALKPGDPSPIQQVSGVKPGPAIPPTDAKSGKSQVSPDQLSRLRSMGHGVIGKPTRGGKTQPGKTIASDLMDNPVQQAGVPEKGVTQKRRKVPGLSPDKPDLGLSPALSPEISSGQDIEDSTVESTETTRNVPITQSPSRMRTTAPLSVDHDYDDDSSDNPRETDSSDVRGRSRSSLDMFNKKSKRMKPENDDWR